MFSTRVFTLAASSSALARLAAPPVTFQRMIHRHYSIATRVSIGLPCFIARDFSIYRLAIYSDCWWYEFGDIGGLFPRCLQWLLLPWWVDRPLLFGRSVASVIDLPASLDDLPPLYPGTEKRVAATLANDFCETSIRAGAGFSFHRLVLLMVKRLGYHFRYCLVGLVRRPWSGYLKTGRFCLVMR